MTKQEPVKFVRVSDTEDAIVINVSRPKCRKCGEALYGGEINFGICDCCENGD